MSLTYTLFKYTVSLGLLVAGVVTEGSRYGPKREEDDYSGDMAPDFFQNSTQQILNPVTITIYIMFIKSHIHIYNSCKIRLRITRNLGESKSFSFSI